MRIATFNIYWLGNKDFVKWSGLPGRKDADWSLIGHVLGKLDTDVIVFQEIVDLDELQRVLDRANHLTGRTYQIHDHEDRLLGTGKANSQKVVIAYDEQQYALETASPLHVAEGRLPFAARLRSLSTGGSVLVVGIHLKSGQPQFDDESSAERRKQQCQHLADWIVGLKAAVNPVLPQPVGDEPIVIVGDFNALYELEPDQPESWRIVVDSLTPLREGGMEEWWWQKPLADPATPADRTTSYIEGLLIDFVMLSPSLKNRVVRLPSIYAYDQDPEITDNLTREVRYRVSDHRPVYVEVDV